MKKILLFALVMCIGLVSFSQTNFNVFNVRKLDSIPIPEFMGVKIEGSRTEIISKLKAKGFNPAQTSSQNKNATILISLSTTDAS